ncbi:NACHT domain-containing protein [Amycolatopsis japonica]|uniref:NACHT domain-containing protein n=1 Tax=Amycolatopsis japonica TaxID=208439 RepID=UPI0037F26EE5
MSSLEALLGPSIAKAATSGAIAAGKWGARAALSGQRKRKLRSLLDAKGSTKCEELLERLTPLDVSRVLAFCDSPEFAHCANLLARARLVEGVGRKSDKISKSVKIELSESLGLHLGRKPDQDLVEVLFSALNESVALNIKRLSDSDLPASAELKAELIKTIASLAAASARNADVLRTFARIEEIDDFISELKSQVIALHGTMRLPHAGTTRQVPYDQLFVQPRLKVAGLNRHKGDVSVAEFAAGIGGRRDLMPANTLSDVSLLLDNCSRAVILGDPGGGKSTLSRNLAFLVASETEGISRAPFFVELRDYAKALNDGSPKKTFVEYLEGLCRSPYGVSPPPNAVEYLLLNDRAVVIFDGLDELLDTSLRRSVVEIVEAFVYKFPTCPILVTSRRVGYEEAPLDPDLFYLVGLRDFSIEDVKKYVSNWFNLDESIQPQVKARLTSSFMQDSQFVSDLRKNPLMLSLMCGIYASENYIPTNRPDVYEKCSLLLFDRWDKQRGIESQLPFDAHVQAAMRALALYMLTDSPDAYLSRLKTLAFLKRYLLERRFESEESAENAAVEFVDFCKGRAWVLTDIGSDTYGFTHRTFLEYFSASQLVRQNSSAASLYEALRGRLIAKEWDVVAQLALQILGRQVEDGADDFLLLAIEDFEKQQGSSSLNLASFLVRSLEFIVPKPAVVQRICELALEATRPLVKSVAGHAQIGRHGPPVGLLMFVAAENRPRVADALRRAISTAIAKDDQDELAAFTCFLLFSATGVESAQAREFWRRWSVENYRSHFSDLARSLRAKYWWLAMFEFEVGEATLSEVLDWHGLFALYRFDLPTGPSQWAPFAYRCLTGFYSPHGDHVEVSQQTIHRRISRQLSVNAERISEMRIRSNSQEVMDAITAAVVRLETGGFGAPRIMLALPILEFLSNSFIKEVEAARGKYDDVASAVAALAATRFSGITAELINCRVSLELPTGEVLSKLDRAFRGRPDLRMHLESWLKGEHSFLPKRRRSRRAIGDR